MSTYLSTSISLCALVQIDINVGHPGVRSLVARVGGYEVFDHSYDAVVIGAGGAGALEVPATYMGTTWT